MVLVSSPQSVRRGTPSLLAMVETIAASSISFWLAWKHNSVEHIVIASGLAPFLLLRTRLSTWYTVRVIRDLDQRTHSSEFNPIIVIILLPIIKIICSIKVFLRRPLKSISNVPENFYKYVSVIDLANSPEVLPGFQEIPKFTNTKSNTMEVMEV